MTLDNRVVMITGASSGLGEQIAYASAKKGYRLVLAARRYEQLEKVATKCLTHGASSVNIYTLDIGKIETIDRVYAQIKEDVGQVDILVNNAGFGLFEELIHIDLKTIQEMFNVNVVGLIYLSRIVVADMLAKGRGHLINIASQAGKMATPKSTIYAATKHAVLGFSNALRLEVKPYGVQVTTVNPGPIKTDFFARADKTGHYLDDMGIWVLDPSKLANRIVASYDHTTREINAPFLMNLGANFYTLFPHLGDFLAGTVFNKK